MLYSTVPESILVPGVKQIVTVHDLIPLKYPELHPKLKYYFTYVVPIILKNSHAIICDSQNTAKDIICHYGIKDKPIHAIPLGVNRKTFYPRPKGVGKNRFPLTKYFLYVGDMKPYKNLEKSFEAFALLNLKGSVKFVVVGKKDPKFYPNMEKKVEELAITQEVVFFGYVPDEDLPYLYSDAAGLIFPSLYEGFGLPALEAMACGCPVIASNTSSLPEVCGDAAQYVNPHSVEEIAEGMYTVITNENVRRKLVQNGLKRVKLFSWEKTAKNTLKVIEDVLAM